MLSFAGWLCKLRYNSSLKTLFKLGALFEKRRLRARSAKNLTSLSNSGMHERKVDKDDKPGAGSSISFLAVALAASKALGDGRC